MKHLFSFKRLQPSPLQWMDMHAVPPLLRFLHKLTQANLSLEANQNVRTINLKFSKQIPYHFELKDHTYSSFHILKVFFFN